MAKLNKIMPPRRVDIQGDDHLLAYITPEEAALLKSLGGAGEPGPMGIPHYRFSSSGRGGGRAGAGMDSSRGFDGGGREDTADAFESFRGSSEEEDAGVQQDIAAAAASSAGVDLGDYSYDTGFDPSGYGPQIQEAINATIGQANVDAITRLKNQLSTAQNFKMQPVQPGLVGLLGYNTPKNILGKINALAGGYTMPRMIEALGIAGNKPVYGFGGKITGVADPYGNLIEGTDPNESLESTRIAGGAGRDGGSGNIADTRPVNPVTGQCDEGYMFDEDLQACRLDTGYQAAASTGGAFGAPGDQYARMGLLDVAPTGLPQFQQQYGAGFGSPTDFAAANTAFRRQGAYEPANFQNPYPTTGYTLLS